MSQGPWTLSQAAFDRFLAALDSDRGRAAEKYERTRRQLITFFRHRDCADPEARADETLDRVIRRSEEIEVRSLGAFVLGVARRVASEYHKQDAAAALADEPAAPPPREDRERLLACLDRCLGALPGAERGLILDYYQYERRQKTEAHRRWARWLGLGETALRVRAFRIRQKLERCVAACAKEEWRP
jgi:DNA-directed RNA polymerase specialized sigma24 family protein